MGQRGRPKKAVKLKFEVEEVQTRKENDLDNTEWHIDPSVERRLTPVLHDRMMSYSRSMTCPHCNSDRIQCLQNHPGFKALRCMACQYVYEVTPDGL